MFAIRKSFLAVLAVAAISAGIGGWKFSDIKSVLPELTGGPEISEKAEGHILYGDKSGGGHLHGVGKPCKSEFPEDWEADDILDNVRKVAANDNLSWKQQKNGYHVAAQTIDGVRVRVVLNREKDGVVTAYPVNLKANACPTTAKRKSRTQRQRSADMQEEAANDNVAATKTYNFNR